ncbi:MAG: hypothetical protein ACXW3Z_08330 [Limisphaerales bacterium]
MNTLDTLTAEQLDQLYDWLLEMPASKVVEKVAQPAPEGFGLQTHITTLQRFKIRRWAELAADQLEAARAIAAAANSNNSDDVVLDTAIASTLKRQLFERASAPNATSEDLALLARYVQRNEKLKLDIERVQIARERLAQNNRRLELLERAQQVREKTLELRREDSEHRRATNSQLKTQNAKLEAQADHLGPYAADLEGIRERARKHFGITPEESARRAALRKAWMARESSNSGDETHAAAEPVFVRENPSPEGTLDNSPATSVPGNLAAFNPVPEGRLNSPFQPEDESTN